MSVANSSYFDQNHTKHVFWVIIRAQEIILSKFDDQTLPYFGQNGYNDFDTICIKKVKSPKNPKHLAYNQFLRNVTFGSYKFYKKKESIL